MKLNVKASEKVLNFDHIFNEKNENPRWYSCCTKIIFLTALNAVEIKMCLALNFSIPLTSHLQAVKIQIFKFKYEFMLV